MDILKYKEHELSVLTSFLQPKLSLMVPSLIIEGAPSTGKSFTVNKYLEYLKKAHGIEHFVIECDYCFTQREILRKIHKILMVHFDLAFTEFGQQFPVCDNVNMLPSSIKRMIQHADPELRKQPIIFVLDRIDSLPANENPSELIKCLSKLHELDDEFLDIFTFIHVITRYDSLDISTLSLPNIKFGTYSNEEFKDIINVQCCDKFWELANVRKQEIQNTYHDDNETDDENDTKRNNEEFVLNISESDRIIYFKQFVDIILNTYSSYVGKNLEIIIPILRKIWPIFIDPVIHSGSIVKGQNDIFTVFMKNKELLSKEFAIVTKLDNSDISLLDYKDGNYKSFENLNDIDNDNNIGHYDLSMKTKYLVIAAFLASYNEPKFDSQMFSKGSEYNLIIKSRSKRFKKSHGDGKLRRDISAALPFKLERLLAILNAIWNENVGDNSLINDVELMTEIATLSSLKTLIKVKGGDTIGGVTKWKCNVHWNIVKKFASDVGFEIENHLQD